MASKHTCKTLPVAFSRSVAIFLRGRKNNDLILLSIKNDFMAKNNLQESQQTKQNVTIGTQGNQDSKVSHDTKGRQHSREQDDRHIPNQEQSSRPGVGRADSGPEQNI
jgi:hypothetical protein